MSAIARGAEDRDYASLWTFQRILTPLDGSLGPAHDSVHDSIVALSFVAGMTSRIRLGTATLCAPYVAPAVLAKALSSLDVVSGGRLTVGLGQGWLAEEAIATDVPPHDRGARFEEYLRCLHALWTDDPVEFTGAFYTVPRSHQRPRPQQQPHPPVLVGGTAPAALRRAGRLAQGWIASSGHDHAEIGRSTAVVREAARTAGRDPAGLTILVRGVVDLVDHDPGPDRRPLHGTREQVVDDLVALRSAGVTEVLLDLNLSPRVTGEDVDVDDALAYSEGVMDAFAPTGLGDAGAVRSPRPSA